MFASSFSNGSRRRKTATAAADSAAPLSSLLPPPPPCPYATRTTNLIIDTYPTLRKLLLDRGYNVRTGDMASAALTARAIGRAHAQHGTSDVLFVVDAHDTSVAPVTRTAVIYPQQPRPRADPVRAYRAHLSEHGIRHCIVVSEQLCMNRRLFGAFAEDGCQVEMFTFDELAYPVALRNDMPMHVRLTPQQIDEQLAPLGGSTASVVHQLPRLAPDDFMARAMDCGPGAIVAVARPTGAVLRAVSVY